MSLSSSYKSIINQFTVKLSSHIIILLNSPSPVALIVYETSRPAAAAEVVFVQALAVSHARIHKNLLYYNCLFGNIYRCGCFSSFLGYLLVVVQLFQHY